MTCVYLVISSLAAASSATIMAILLAIDVDFYRAYPYLTCSRFKVSVIQASMAWSFVAASADFTF